MAKKPIIGIDVDDSQFKSFYELFSKYQADIKSMPEAWKGANEVLNAGVAAIAEQTHNISKHLNSATTAQKQFANATHTSFTGMKKMAGEAKKVADSIFGIGKFVLKMGAWGGGLFAGSLFGIDKLAGSALSAARGARGIGVSPGELRAFGTDYRQIAPENLPNSVFGAQHDLSKLGVLGFAAGLSPDQVQGMDPVALSQVMVQRAHDYYRQNKNNPAMMSQQAAAMMGFQAAGLGVEDVERIGVTPDSDLSDASRRFSGDRNRFNYSDAALNGLRNFQYQIEAAGKSLETNLSQHLSKLGPSLGGLVTNIGKDAEILLNGLFSQKNVDVIKKGLDEFTAYLSSGKAMADVKKFGSALSDLADLIHKIAHPIKTIHSKSADAYVKALAGDSSKHKNATYLEALTGDYSVTDKAAARAALGAPVAGGVGAHGKPMTKAQESALEKSLGFKPGTLAALKQTESSGRANALSGKGAMGLFQLMPDTAKGLGVTDPYDPIQNELGGAKYLAQMRAFVRKLKPGASGKENMEMALAAYNFGPGNFKDFYAKHHGDDWKAYLPRETRREIASFEGNMGGRDLPILQQIARNTAQPVKIEITSTTPTSSRVAMQANAAR